MKTTAIAAAAIAVIASTGPSPSAQETKPVPKDSVRVSVPGCTQGYIFTVGRLTEDQAGSVGIREGTHLRMNGPKKMIAAIKAHEGSVILLTGLMKKGQYAPGGVNIGGVRIGPGLGPGIGVGASAGAGQIYIDVEGWRPGDGSCPR